MLDVELEVMDFRLPITSFRIHPIENSCSVFTALPQIAIM
jgi:hypothetical protein